MPESSLVALNLRSALSAYANATAGGVTAALPGMGLVDSGVPFAVFNAAVLSDLVSREQFSELLDQAGFFYEQRRTPWSCWYCPDHVQGESQSAVERVLFRRGLRLSNRHTGMYADGLNAPGRFLPDLAVVRVQDGPTRRDFISVCLSSFGLPARIAMLVYGADRFWRGGWTAWVGYDTQDRPVTMAATDTSAGVVGVYCVGTVPEARGRGYAETITRRAIDAALRQTTARALIVQSTPAGLGLYRRMGFRPVGEFAVFVKD